MKRSMFLNVIKGSDEYLLHNTLYGKIVKAKCDVTKSIADALMEDVHFEYEDSNSFHRSLKEYKMIVEDDLDEINLLNYRMSEVNRSSLQIIMFVTRQCDFRCVYCYEKHENKRMSHEIYENLLKAIKKEVKVKGYKAISLSFFGGEPMLEYKAICAFMEKINEFASEENISVYGSMTTNAYSLSLDKLQRLVELNVSHYQITIDGLKETHDSSRFLVGGGGSWDRIIQNLKNAQNSALNFDILLRTNFNSNIIEKINDYLQYLSANFASDRRFKTHFEAVKELRAKEGDHSNRDNEHLNKNDDEAKVLTKILVLAKELKLNMFKFRLWPFSYICYASKNNSLVIDTDGTLMKCTVAIDWDKNVVGKLTNKGFEIEDTKICEWTSYNLPNYCYNCKILTLCFGRKCPVNIKNVCTGDLSHCLRGVSFYEDSLRYIFQIS